MNRQVRRTLRGAAHRIAPDWAYTGSLGTGRHYTCLPLLPDDRVLAKAGYVYASSQNHETCDSIAVP
jgi:hypothetical protein